MRKRYKVLSLLLLIALLGTCFPAARVEAGARTISITGTTFKSDGDWNNLRSQVTVDGEKLIFPVDSTAKTGMICKTVIRGDQYFDDLTSAECNLKFTKLPAGQSFVLAFGLAGIESSLGNKGNVEVTFTNNNGIKVGVVAYETKGTPITVCNPTATGMGLGTVAKVEAKVLNSGNIIVSINGNKVCSGKLPITGEGRFGFLQTGSCAAEVTDFNLKAYQYYRPENSNISEDFSEGSLNISVLMGKTLVGNKTFSFGEHQGEPVLKMNSIGQTFIGTHAGYSNFEMTFDVPYLSTKAGIDENGDPMEPTGKLGVSFGSPKTNASKDAYKNAIDAVIFDKNLVYSVKNEKTYTAENPYWSTEKPFSLQVIVKDCEVTVGAKWMNEKSYQPLLSYKLTNQDITGYVHLWVIDRANCAIDNFKITNLDDNPTLVEKEFVSGKIEKPADWEYEPFDRVYAPEKQETDEEDATVKTFSWYLLIPTTALAGVVVLVITDTVVRAVKKAKKKKEVVIHEK